MAELDKRSNPAEEHVKNQQREAFLAGIRAANRPDRAPLREGAEQPPPYPEPKLDVVLAMPDKDLAQIRAKRDAARRWLEQFCARARFLLKTKDLRSAAQTHKDCAAEINKIRHWVDAAEIERILTGS